MPIDQPQTDKVTALTAQLKQVGQPPQATVKASTAATLIKPASHLHITTTAKHDPTQLFIPPGSITSTSIDTRIAIIGAPGSGKTTSCLTFPNRIWADFDHKLPANETSMPFWNSDFCDKLATRTFKTIVNRRDAFKFWLRDNHAEFHEDQTFILDSWTLLMNAFEVQTSAEDELLDQNDKSNKYYLHKQRLLYCRQIFECLKAMRCIVVVTFHEAADRDKDGELNGKVRPLMDGQFKDQIFGQFTDVWRQRANIYETDPRTGIVIRDKENGNKPKLKLVEHNNNQDWRWFWQLLGDAEFDTNCNPDLGEKVRKHKKYLVPADYNEIKRIMALQ